MKVMGTASLRKVKKDRLQVTIFTHHHKVVGDVHILPANRLTDFMNEIDQRFLAVTKAEVCDLAGKEEVIKLDFLTINKNHITMVFPLS